MCIIVLSETKTFLFVTDLPNYILIIEFETKRHLDERSGKFYPFPMHPSRAGPERCQ